MVLQFSRDILSFAGLHAFIIHFESKNSFFGIKIQK